MDDDNVISRRTVQNHATVSSAQSYHAYQRYACEESTRVRIQDVRTLEENECGMIQLTESERVTAGNHLEPASARSCDITGQQFRIMKH